MKYLLISLLALGGCASVTKPDNELRVTEYGANGSYLTNFDGKVAGVRVVAKGTIDGCLEYKGAKAKYTSKDCSKQP
jgi:hypothetical protein